MSMHVLDVIWSTILLILVVVIISGLLSLKAQKLYLNL